MSSHDTEKEAIEAAVLTDIDGNPITCDKNPAHFDGFLTEVAAYIGRTGKWLPLVEQGVSIRGHRTVVDSPAAVPFVQGSIAGARVYSPDDPCPPTAARADFFTKPMSPEKFIKFRNHIMNIEPRAALAATCKAVARAPGNGVPLSATAVPFFPSA